MLTLLCTDLYSRRYTPLCVATQAPTADTSDGTITVALLSGVGLALAQSRSLFRKRAPQDVFVKAMLVAGRTERVTSTFRSRTVQAVDEVSPVVWHNSVGTLRRGEGVFLRYVAVFRALVVGVGPRTVRGPHSLTRCEFVRVFDCDVTGESAAWDSGNSGVLWYSASSDEAVAVRIEVWSGTELVGHGSLPVDNIVGKATAARQVHPLWHQYQRVAVVTACRAPSLAVCLAVTRGVVGMCSPDQHRVTIKTPTPRSPSAYIDVVLSSTAGHDTIRLRLNSILERLIAVQKHLEEAQPKLQQLKEAKIGASSGFTRCCQRWPS